ncbi:MAG: YceI family protein [Flavobacterium sp.]|nr:YceI family protein [Flavobacterium sp.]
MKKIILIILFFIVNSTFAQKELMTTQGRINFEASVPLFEEVNATNETAKCVLNTKNGELKTVVRMKDFRFKLSLMENHFNENYLETDRYPLATLKGKIQGFNWNIIGTTAKEFKMKGKLEIHGKSKEITTTLYLKKIENGLEIISDFTVNIHDFNIKIPQMLSMKIAEKVNIKTLFVVQ